MGFTDLFRTYLVPETDPAPTAEPTPGFVSRAKSFFEGATEWIGNALAAPFRILGSAAGQTVAATVTPVIAPVKSLLPWVAILAVAAAVLLLAGSRFMRAVEGG